MLSTIRQWVCHSKEASSQQREIFMDPGGLFLNHCFMCILFCLYFSDVDRRSKIQTCVMYSSSTASVMPIKSRTLSSASYENIPPTKRLSPPKLTQSSLTISTPKPYQTLQHNTKVRSHTLSLMIPPKPYCHTAVHSKSPVILHSSQVTCLQYLGEGCESNV